jgi:DNA-binding CsgD family transcriptional regulator
MPQIRSDVLSPFAAKFMEGKNLTPAERAEVLRIAQGLASKESAALAGIASHTVRARRKRIYRKLHVSDAGELISSLLAFALEARTAEPSLESDSQAAS